MAELQMSKLGLAAWEKERDAELCIAPGAGDLTFGSILETMIGRMFLRVETLKDAGPRRFYTECTQCQGTDEDRPFGQRPSITLVKHADDCLLHKHLPRLRAMARKGVT